MSCETSIDDSSETFSRGPNNEQRYRIRAMRQTDIEMVAAIDKTIWQEESWAIEVFFRIVDHPRWNCWILERIDSDPIIIGHGHQRLSNGISHLKSICIHPDQHGCGFGTILLRYMIECARQKDALIIRLEVKTSNTRAYKLYVDHGFRTVGHLPEYYQDYSAAHLMELLLRAPST